MAEEISLKCNKDVQTPGSRRMFRSRRGKITLLNSVLDGFDPVELVDDLPDDLLEDVLERDQA